MKTPREMINYLTDAGMSQHDIAKALLMSQGNISQHARADKGMGKLHLQKLNKLYIKEGGKS